MRERIEQHPFDLVVGEAVARLHLDRGLLARRFLARGDAQDAVGVDHERHLQPRHPGRHGGNPLQREPSQRTALAHQLALPLHDVQVESGLLVGVGRERLLRAARHRRVAVNQLLGDAAHGLEPQRQRHDVQQQHVVVARAAREHVGLHGRAQRDHLIGIDVGQRGLPERLLDEPAHQRHPRRAAH